MHLSGPVTVQFLDDTSAIVALSRRDLIRDVMRALTGNPKVTLVPYVNYKCKLAAKVNNT
jgi:hypothetical protein